MLPNSYEDAADILKYIPRKRGHHKWIFIDTDKVDIPEGSKTVSLWYGDGDDAEQSAVAPDELTFFNDHVEVIGDDYIEYVRDHRWPGNVFINRLFLEGSQSNEQNAQRNNWVVNVYGYQSELRDRIDEDDLCRYARTTPHAFAIAPVECEHSEALPWEVSSDSTFEDPDPGDEAVRLIHQASETHALVEKWIYFAPDTNHPHLRQQHSGVVYVANGGEDFTRERYVHIVHHGHSAIPYFRRNWWPEGVFRLAEVYYTDDVNRDGKSYIPVFDDEPSLADCATFEISHSHESGRLIASQYQERYNLQYAFTDGRGSDFRNHDHDADPHHWVYLEAHSEIRGIGESEGSISISVSDYDVSSYSCRTHVEHGTGEYHGEISLYRYARWPRYVWSTIWNTDSDGQKVPAYGADAFGATCPYDDDSTRDEPVSAEGGFAYQKWIRPTWDPIAVSTRGSGFMSVGFSEGRYVSRPRDSTDTYHIRGWTESIQRYQATYFRRPTFPAGLWRRADCFTDSVRGGSATMSMSILTHDDEPGCADAPAPWYSAYLTEWVMDIERRSGRSVSYRTDGTAPWLKFWTPLESESQGSDGITVSIGGHQVVLPVGELPRIRGHSRGTNILDDNHNYHIARRYRSGVALAFNPCGVRYADEAVEGQARPHPLKLILDQIEDFYLEYHDPDVVEDLVDDMFERVKIKVQGFNDIVRREQSAVRAMQQSMLNSAKKISDLLEKRSYYDKMSKGRFRHTLQQHRNLVTNLGSLKLDGDFLTLRMHVFAIEDQPIGPLRIAIDISGQSLPMLVTSDDNQSQHENPHPHVDVDGRVCWGSGTDIAAQMAVGADPLEYMFWAANVLREGYRADDAYCTIANWEEKNVWWCEYCEVDHPNDTQCPNHCGYCDLQVYMDEHNHCSRHGCWDDDDSDHGDCPACEEEQQEDSDREEEEEREREQEREREEEERERLELLEGEGAPDEPVVSEAAESEPGASQESAQREEQQVAGEESAAE